MFELRIEKKKYDFSYFNPLIFFEYTHIRDNVCQCIKWEIYYNEEIGEWERKGEYRITDIFSDDDLIPYPTA